MVSGMYTIRSMKSGKRLCPIYSRRRQSHMLMAKTRSSMPRLPFSMRRLSITISPKFMPMKNIGMRLKNISMCPTLS